MSMTGPSRTTLLKELRALIVSGTPGLDRNLSESESLIVSGLLESTTLVSVALWVEDRIGREMDLGAFDLVAEWDTMEAIVDFVERQAAGPGALAPRDR
jgi:acyl carrier protein